MKWRKAHAAAAIGLMLSAAQAGLSTVGAAVPAKEPVIVALGDSLTAGYELPGNKSFPAQLEAALRAKGHGVTVINAGVSGDTAADGLQRFDWAVPNNAQGIIIELGANDALQGLPPAATKATLEKIIARAEQRKLPILLAGMEAPRNLGKEYVEQFHALYADLAAKHDVVFYPFFLDGVAMQEKLTLPDGMHPNAKGVQLIVQSMLPKVEELLQRIPASG